jgi:hypothetical protein
LREGLSCSRSCRERLAPGRAGAFLGPLAGREGRQGGWKKGRAHLRPTIGAGGTFTRPWGRLRRGVLQPTPHGGKGVCHAEARLPAGRGSSDQQARLLTDLAEVGAELAALLTEGVGALDQVQGLPDEFICPGVRLGPGAGQVAHAVASCHRATLPSPSTYQVGWRCGRWQIGGAGRGGESPCGGARTCGWQGRRRGERAYGGRRS